LENTFGRKGLLSFTLLFTGAILIASLGIPSWKYLYNCPVLVFAWIANIALNIAWSGAKEFTKDLFQQLTEQWRLELHQQLVKLVPCWLHT